MIESPLPTDWRQLQAGVCRLLNEVGLTAELEKKLSTPRGEVEIDVYAVDENSVEKISYLVECKNWSSAVPQTVVHAFTTVMQEVGGNVGFIVSKQGFQAGARDYLRNTNIIGISYLELQQRYWPHWWNNYFVPTIGNAAEHLVEYIEPINTFRDRKIAELPEEKRNRIESLRDRYTLFGMGVAFYEFPRYSSRFNIPPASDIDDYKAKIREAYGEEFTFSSEYFRDLAEEISEKIRSIASEFHSAFGSNIFERD